MNENDIEGEEDGIAKMDGEVKVHTFTSFSLIQIIDLHYIFWHPDNAVQYERRIGRRPL